MGFSFFTENPFRSVGLLNLYYCNGTDVLQNESFIRTRNVSFNILPSSIQVLPECVD